MSKTPQFDKALAEHFTKLKLDELGGQWRTCRFSGEKFYIRPEDIAFYKKIGTPLPTLHPNERWRRVIAYSNSYNLFRTKSALTGKMIVPSYPPNSPFSIYEHQKWFSDAWDPLSYKRTYDPDESFWSQFRRLRHTVPRPNLVSHPANIRSDYTNLSSNLKDCYLVFNTLSGENLYYVDGQSGSKDCLDGNSFINCETCYRGRFVRRSYRCFFFEDCEDCLESYFLLDCRNCDYCFMSANLRHKKYVFRGEQLTKEKYEEKMQGINFGNYDELVRFINEFNELKRNAFYKPDDNFRAVRSLGDYIVDSKNCYHSMYVRNSENVNYSLGLINYKDSYDVVGGGGGELCYELITVSTFNNYNVRFSAQLDNCCDVEYSDLCRNCTNCFGCVGLSNKSFCVLNRQYKESEYWPLVDSIKTAMLAAGDYGEFFPPALAPVPYKISFATSYTGFDDYDRAAAYGYDMQDMGESEPDVASEVIPASGLPVDIKDVTDDILQKTIFDETNKKYFRIMPYELEFYRRNRLALPREYPLMRLFAFRKPYPVRLTFYDRRCTKCHASIRTPRDPSLYENVLCEECYNKEVV